MSEIEKHSQEGTETTASVIEQIYVGECESLSARSRLTFSIGRAVADGSLYLRIVRNSSSGATCTDWASATDINNIVIAHSGLTAKSFHCLHPGKSVNTGGFILGVLKHLKLIRANAENSRVHEHIPSVTLQQAVSARIAEFKEEQSKTNRKKGRSD